VDLCSITELRDYKATREEVDLFNNLRATGKQGYGGGEIIPEPIIVERIILHSI
jgi:hypothetical protein